MPFRATIQLDSMEEQPIIHCDLRFRLPVNENNRPVGRPTPDVIYVVMRSDLDSEFAFTIYSWCEQRGVKSGTIKFYKDDNTGVLKDLTFEEAFLIEYREVFDAEGTQTMRMHLTISAGTTSMCQGSGFLSDWVAERNADSNSSSSSSSSSSASSSSGSGVSSFDAS